MSVEVVAGPETNAALVVPLSPGGHEISKASGCLVRWKNRLLLLTNWHVVSGKRWASAAERAADPEAAHRWVSRHHCYPPSHLRISTWSGHSRLHLRTVALRTEPDVEDITDGPLVAWDRENDMLSAHDEMPGRDLVCLEVARDLEAQERRLEYELGRRIRLGYDVAEVGRGYGFDVAHQIFVVGYPSTIGQDERDPPVWTSGTVASDPMRDWQGPRFLIDSRTREGQSGSAVITYAPEGRGLPARQQVVGVYSGRIEEKADIGSVWPLEALLQDLEANGPVMKRIDDPELEGRRGSLH